MTSTSVLPQGLTNPTALAFHWSQAAALLNKTLSTGVKPSERDALWVCASLLGALSFTSIQAQTPEEAWPLKPDASSDLYWLKISKGKSAIWKIIDSLKPDFIQFALSAISFWSDLQNLPQKILELC